MGVRFSVKSLFIVALATAALMLCSVAVFNTADAAAAKKGIWALTNERESNNPRFDRFLTQFNQKPKRVIHVGIYGQVPPYGDSGLDLRDLRWSSWGGAKARAKGELRRPKTRKKAVTIEFSQPRRCGGWRIYTHLRLVDWEGKDEIGEEPDYDLEHEAWLEWDKRRERYEYENEDLHDRPVRFYRRCEVMAPTTVNLRGATVKPQLFQPLPPKSLAFQINSGWKGWGSKRAFTKRVVREVLCGFNCVLRRTSATLTVSDIRFCRGTLMYTRVTARWNGKKKQYRVGGKWCRPGFVVS